MTMRTQKVEKHYAEVKEQGGLRPLYDETPIKDFKYWRIVENRFPHDKIADLNHMIVLKREVKDIRHINLMEWIQLLKVVWYIRHDYNTFTYNLPSMSSVKNIPHAHLYRLRQEYR